MVKLIEQWIDRLSERRVRKVAQSTSRRSAVAKLGSMLVGGAILPMLPFDRSLAPPSMATWREEWRSAELRLLAQLRHRWLPVRVLRRNVTACPPGTEISRSPGSAPAATRWTRGTTSSRTTTAAERAAAAAAAATATRATDPCLTRPPRATTSNWCHGTSNNVYNCSMAVVIGLGLASGRPGS